MSRHFWRCKQFIRQVDTAANDKMFGLKYGPRKMTLEKPLVGRFRLPSVRPWGKAPNRELPPKSGDITCMHSFYRISYFFVFYTTWVCQMEIFGANFFFLSYWTNLVSKRVNPVSNWSTKPALRFSSTNQFCALRPCKAGPRSAVGRAPDS